MRNNGITHDRKTQDAMRLMVMDCLLVGEDIMVVIARCKFCRTTGYRLFAKVHECGRGKQGVTQVTTHCLHG